VPGSTAGRSRSNSIVPSWEMRPANRDSMSMSSVRPPPLVIFCQQSGVKRRVALHVRLTGMIGGPFPLCNRWPSRPTTIFSNETPLFSASYHQSISLQWHRS